MTWSDKNAGGDADLPSQMADGYPEWHICKAMCERAATMHHAKVNPALADLNGDLKELTGVALDRKRSLGAVWRFGSARRMSENLGEVLKAVHPGLAIGDKDRLKANSARLTVPIWELLTHKGVDDTWPALVVATSGHTSVAASCQQMRISRQYNSQYTLIDFSSPMATFVDYSKVSLTFGGNSGLSVAINLCNPTDVFEPPAGANHSDCRLVWTCREQKLTDHLLKKNLVPIDSECLGYAPDIKSETLLNGLWHTLGRKDWVVRGEDGVFLGTRHPDLEVWLFSPHGNETSLWGHFLQFALHPNGKILDGNGTTLDLNERLRYDPLLRGMLLRATGLRKG